MHSLTHSHTHTHTHARARPAPLGSGAPAGGASCCCLGLAGPHSGVGVPYAPLIPSLCRRCGGTAFPCRSFTRPPLGFPMGAPRSPGNGAALHRSPPPPSRSGRRQSARGAVISKAFGLMAYGWAEGFGVGGAYSRMLTRRGSYRGTLRGARIVEADSSTRRPSGAPQSCTWTWPLARICGYTIRPWHRLFAAV